MRHVNGMHWPNQRTWHLEQLMRAVGPHGAVTVLHHQCFDRDEFTGHGGDHENLLTYGPLRYGVDPTRHGEGRHPVPAAPERLIHIRAFERHVGGGTSWRDVNPHEWGARIARKLSRWTGHNYPETNLWFDPFVAVSLCNEQNIEGWVVSHLGGERERREAYGRIGRWQLDAWRALDAELDRMGIKRKALACWGALAFGHDMIPGQADSEYAHPDIRAAIEYCDLLAAHPYGLRGEPKSYADSNDDLRHFYMLRPFRAPNVGGQELGGCLAQFPGKPLLITEANTFSVDIDPPEVTLAANLALLRVSADSGRCVGVTIYMWSASQDHWQNDISSPALRDGFERMPKISTGATLPASRAEDAPPPVAEPSVADADRAYLAALRRRGVTLKDVREDVRQRYADRPHFNFRRRRGGAEAVTHIVQHHSAGGKGAGPYTLWTYAVDEAPWHDGQQTRYGWDTISYGTVIDSDGRVWVGAYPGDFTWHTGGQNAHSYGVCIPGNFTREQPNPESLRAMRHVHAALREALGDDRLSWGHAEMPGQATACPGTHLLPHVVKMREDPTTRLLASLRGAQVISPNPEAALQRQAAQDGYTALLSNEIRHLEQGTTWVAQLFADVSSGRERAYYAQDGLWHDVRHVEA